MTLLESTTPPARVPAGPQATYGDVLRVPYAARLLAGTIIGRLPCGTAPLAILLSTRSLGLAVSAALAALYLLSSAVGGPLIGRLVDRYGQTAPFSAAAVLSGAALLALVPGSHHLAYATAAVAVAGAAKPPLEAGLRAILGSDHVMPSPQHRRTALSLDAASQELIYVLGPLLVATIALTSSSSWALLATALLGSAGTALVVTARPSRTWTAEHRTPDWLGPLRSSRLAVLYAAMVGVGVPMGAITPLAAQSGDALGAPWLAGALPAALSLGALIGGLLYGARLWAGAAAQHLLVLTVAFAVSWLPMTLAITPGTVLAAAAVPGLLMAPLLSAGFTVVAELAPRGTATEAQALLVAALDVGCAAGAAGAGLMPGVALLAAGAGFGALVLVAARRRLRLADGLPPASARSTSGGVR
ncbi:MFS transporter [Streptomyces sp. NPDC006640]|uniref:MFS transporter n=1 Tax=unclassified Streptomyces TaxID=2593676 RepID=UPI0036855C2C